MSSASSGSGDPLSRIIDIARWSPSGDNAQPWRFVRVTDNRFRVDTLDQSQHCVYELDGRCNWISIGTLLETLRIAASANGYSASIATLPTTNRFAPSFAVDLHADPHITPDPLAQWIESRCVNRFPYSRRYLQPSEKSTLQNAVGSKFQISFAEGSSRRTWASINQRAALLRLDTREGWELMTRIIEWDAAFSVDRIPDQAVGMPKWMLKIARRQLETWSWTSTHAMNRFAGGTWMPRLLLEWWPSMCCAAHISIKATRPDDSPEGWIRAGGAVQRMWLAATSLGLSHQPGATPLVFARYARDNIRFTNDERALGRAREMAREMHRILGPDALERTIWIGRIGEAKNPASRSTRQELSHLMSSGSEAP